MTNFAAKTKSSENNTAQSRGGKRKSDNTPLVTPKAAPLFGFPVQRKAACACGGGCPACQAKGAGLPVSQPSDASEIEADAVAEKVMRMSEDKPASIKASASQPKPLAKVIMPLAQAKSDGGADFGDALSGGIAASQGGGHSLDRSAKTFMQNRFGADFGGVKIHTDSQAVQLNRQLNARAFTVGQDIYFNEGQYQPHSESGKYLLAHELTHTIQQQSIIGRKIIQRMPNEVSSPGNCGATFVSAGVGIITNPTEGGEVPYNTGGIPTKENPNGNPLKVGGKTIKLLDGDRVQVGQTGYKYWKAVCLKAADRESPEIFWVRSSYITEEKPTAAPVQEEKGAFEELASSTGTASAPAEYEPHATTEINQMGKMSSDIKSYDDVKTTGKKIRSVPKPEEQYVISRIKYNETIMIRGGTAAGDWFYVSTLDGRQGWTQKDFVAQNMPDSKATIYHTPNREPLEPILAEHYRKTDPYTIKTGDDLRILAMAVYIANKTDGRVDLDKKQFETDLATGFKDLVDPWNEENRRVYRSIRVTSANIWLPGTAYIQQLKAQGSITTRPDWMNALIDTGKMIIGFNAGLISGFFGGIWDMLKGLYELARDLINLVGKVFSGAILEDLQNLYEAVDKFIDEAAADPAGKLREIITAISDAIWGAATDFYNKWTSANTWDKWFFRGEIVGMICLEVVMFLLSGGAANAAKWIAKLSKYAPKLVSFLEKLIKGIDAVTPDVLKRKHKTGGKLDIEPDNDRNREKLTALTIAKGITEANDLKDTDVTVLMVELKLVAAKYKVKFKSTHLGGERYNIDMIASEHTVKHGYTEKKKASSAGASLDDFSNGGALKDGSWIGKPIKNGDPLPEGYTWNDGKIFRKPGKVDANYAPLEVKDGKVALRELPNRISNPTTMNRNYKDAIEKEIRAKNPKWNDAQVKAEAAKQIGRNAVHHLIPDELVRSHPLADAARKQGYDLDRASNLKGLPKSKDLTDVDAGEVGHWSNHPKYTEMVKAELDAVEAKLKTKYGSLDKVPKDELLEEMRKIEDKFRTKFDAGDIPTKDGRLTELTPEETSGEGETMYA